jgi:hypothetical protein
MAERQSRSSSSSERDLVAKTELAKTKAAADPASMEAGGPLTTYIMTGRPDLCKVLKDIQRAHPEALEIPVAFAGA